MLYIIAKKSGSRREIYKINKISEKVLKDTYSSSEGWDYDSLLARESSQDKERRTTRSKEINKLDHLVTNNINDYNDQYNDTIGNEPTLDNSAFNLSSGSR